MKSGRSEFSSGGGHIPPHADNLYMCPPWGISVPVPFFFILIFLLCLRLFPSPYGLVVLLLLVSPSEGGGGSASSPCVSPPDLLLHQEQMFLM